MLQLICDNLWGWACGICARIHFFLFCERSLPGRKWRGDFKEDFTSQGDVSADIIAIGLIVSGVIVFGILLIAFAAFYKIMAFFSDWLRSFVASFVTLAVGYLIYSWRENRREQAEKRLKEKCEEGTQDVNGVVTTMKLK